MTGNDFPLLPGLGDGGLQDVHWPSKARHGKIKKQRKQCPQAAPELHLEADQNIIVRLITIAGTGQIRKAAGTCGQSPGRQ